MNLDEMGPYIDKNTVSLCVSVEILEVQSDLPEPVFGPDPASHPFARLVNNPMFSDVTFRLIEDKEPSSPSTPTSMSHSNSSLPTPDKERVFYAHKSILAASSPWFEALFSNGMRETYENEITLEGVEHAGFLQLLRYCYTLQYPQVRSRRDAERLLALADRFEILPVREECFRYLRVELGMSNVWGTWAVADKYTSERTSTACRQFAALHLAELLDHPSTMNAKPHVLRMALELDEVNVPSEEKIYETIVRWARYHDSTISPRGAELDAARSTDPYASAAAGLDVLSRVDAVVSVPVPAVSSYASSEPDWDATDNTVYLTRSESPTADDDMEISSPTALMPIPASPSSFSITVPKLSPPPAPVLAPAPIFRRYTICSGKSSVRATGGAAPSARAQYHYRASVHSARQYFLPALLACVRFPLMEKKYLVEVVEKDDMVMQADGMKDLVNYSLLSLHIPSS
ncbi:hypothetical protein BC937DRAFT_86390 [Endogone sp. FLAS-F59071]|nr:hypothetical protein BC937DRAFT_86390 [Endogone sp. FLAS-F59071]|eukprot:RUS13073.1 hypothetical protein BC937DRAFT_86390 [Endogone sp. FLAS-F59071]